MSSLRPEELVRKSLGAGFGDHAPTLLHGQPPDGTEVLAIAGADVEFGDWVTVTGNSSGYMTVSTPGATGSAKWVGVVLCAASTGQWCRVKTCGEVIAKVTNAGTLTAGDPLQVQTGTTSARLIDDPGAGAIQCGRFLWKVGGGSNLGWVRLGEGGGESGIVIHHHTDSRNTAWRDKTSGITTFTGYSWHLFRVVQEGLTSGPQRLMLAIGGHSSHGESNLEGHAWGGTIGGTGLGWGQLGGNETSGKQGVLGAERDTGSGGDRINVRSQAGFNVNDLYAGLVYPDGIGPLEFTKPAMNAFQVWAMPAGGDDPGTRPPGLLWWTGALIYDAFHAYGGAAGWSHPWAPGVPVERNCCDVDAVATPADHDGCVIVTNHAQFEANAADLNGSYENIIPYGYTALPGRLDELTAICCFVRHFQGIWRFLDKWTATVEKFMQCVDNTFAGKLDGGGSPGNCCAEAPDVTVPVLNCGPTGGGCEATADPDEA